MAIPDLRRLLSELSPAARFVRAGYNTIGGIRTDPAHERGFLDIGQPQVIRVPARAYLTRGLG